MDNDRRKYEQNFWDWTLNIFLFSKGGRNNNAVTWNSTVPTFQVISNYLIEVSCYLFRCSFFEIFYSRLAKKKRKKNPNEFSIITIHKFPHFSTNPYKETKKFHFYCEIFEFNFNALYRAKLFKRKKAVQSKYIIRTTTNRCINSRWHLENINSRDMVRIV